MPIFLKIVNENVKTCSIVAIFSFRYPVAQYFKTTNAFDCGEYQSSASVVIFKQSFIQL